MLVREGTGLKRRCVYVCMCCYGFVYSSVQTTVFISLKFFSQHGIAVEVCVSLLSERLYQFTVTLEGCGALILLYTH